jgi:hypothetical protein
LNTAEQHIEGEVEGGERVIDIVLSLGDRFKLLLKDMIGGQ